MTSQMYLYPTNIGRALVSKLQPMEKVCLSHSSTIVSVSVLVIVLCANLTDEYPGQISTWKDG